VTNLESTHRSQFRSQLEPVGKVAAYLGAPLFLLGTVLHPARDGPGVATAGEIYGITHVIQSIGLLLVAISLASTTSTMRHRPIAGVTAPTPARSGTVGQAQMAGGDEPAARSPAHPVRETARPDPGSASRSH
jgi:hypothetical protein